MDLKELKQSYKLLRSKHELPLFDEMNECFEIDRVDRDTDFLLREIRKVAMDKVVSYIRFMEMIINPSQAPPMFLMFVKNINGDEKKMVQEVYAKFVELEMNSLKLEIEYNEKNEAFAINKILNVWKTNRGDLKKVIGVMERNWNSNGEKIEKNYFG